jgi:DnaJ like chaperone protein
MFVKDTESMYRILEIEPTASNEEVKKAYRRMAVKYHPDKVVHLGADMQKAANEKFQQLNAAYEELKKQRGMK